MNNSDADDLNVKKNLQVHFCNMYGNLLVIFIIHVHVI